jgi:hypothetical protein
MAFGYFTRMKSLPLHTLKSPIVWVSITLFIINQLLERVWSINIPYVHAYLDDLLCLPIILGLSTQIIQWIHPARNYYYLSKTHLIIAVIFFSVVFELIYPLAYPENFTADAVDVIFYAIGGLLFYWVVTAKSKDKLARLIKDQE